MSMLVRAGQLVALVPFAFAPSFAAARDFKASDLVIQQPWARATPGGAEVAGGYLTINNHGAAADTLTGGSLEAAARFEIHSMTTENGVMKMRPNGPLTIPPGGTVTLAPAGTHIMFTALKHGLKKGETDNGTLSFAHAGTVPVQFEVEGFAARSAAESDDYKGQSMPGMKMS